MPDSQLRNYQNLRAMSGNKNSFPLVRTQTSFGQLPAGKKRRVEISIEHHIEKDAYLLVLSLPKTARDIIVINKTQAESLVKTFKINIINVR